MNERNLLGRITALALMLGAAYGVTGIARGRFACPLGNGSCCAMSAHHDEHMEAAHHEDAEDAEDAEKADADDDAKPAPNTPAAPAKAD